MDIHWSWGLVRFLLLSWLGNKWILDYLWWLIQNLLLLYWFRLIEGLLYLRNHWLRDLLWCLVSMEFLDLSWNLMKRRLHLSLHWGMLLYHRWLDHALLSGHLIVHRVRFVPVPQSPHFHLLFSLSILVSDSYLLSQLILISLLFLFLHL